MNEYKVGKLVRILKFADNNPHGYGHKIGMLRALKNATTSEIWASVSFSLGGA